MKMTEGRNGHIPWGTSRRFNSYAIISERDWRQAAKVSIDAGFTCPNRERTKGLGGCPSAITMLSILHIAALRRHYPSDKRRHLFLGRRYRNNNGYLAYFQAYSKPIRYS
jgi:radical SAM superfamily enzyme